MNALALKVLYTTVQLRHPSNPFFSPESDYIHESLGHAAFLLDPTINKMFHLLGLASLGGTEEEVEKIGMMHYRTIEFGMVN
mmetsp:Transcript_30504/g.29908  ORF Transcript_30504/g.29908 Transcript_30504/m.29908 type:complete len:82 (+) Transcript_30504:127-372(+)